MACHLNAVSFCTTRVQKWSLLLTVAAVTTFGIRWHQLRPEGNGTTQTHWVVHSHRLTRFGHIVLMDDNIDAKRILEDWRRPRGHRRITWLSTIQQELRSHNLPLPEARPLNRSLWRMWSTYGATQSWVVCQKRRRRLLQRLLLVSLGSLKVSQRRTMWEFHQIQTRCAFACTRQLSHSSIFPCYSGLGVYGPDLHRKTFGSCYCQGLKRQL